MEKIEAGNGMGTLATKLFFASKHKRTHYGVHCSRGTGCDRFQDRLLDPLRPTRQDYEDMDVGLGRDLPLLARSLTDGIGSLSTSSAMFAFTLVKKFVACLLGGD